MTRHQSYDGFVAVDLTQLAADHRQPGSQSDQEQPRQPDLECARASLYRRGNIDASTRQVCCRGDIGRALVYRARPTRQHPAFTVVPACGRTGATPLEIGSKNELARRGGALRAVWQADSQRPVGRCAEHDHLVLLTKVE